MIGTTNPGTNSVTRQADPRSAPLTLPFAVLRRADLPLVGGKGANLGEMAGAGFPVPPGFCLTTRAYNEVAASADLAPVFAALNGRKEIPTAELAQLAGQARAAILDAPMPDAVRDALLAAYAELGANVAVAVRSSATAEDLADASFAGQQDTILNVIGPEALLDAVRRCWASLWTDRAVAYRAANGVEHSTVALAVVVQQMVPAVVSGVLFTANPLTNRHGEAIIDATPGLGEALVSGLVNPSNFRVDSASGRILDRQLAPPELAIQPKAGGGTEHVELDPNGAAYISDEQVLAVARLGAQVEQHYGAPQDIEWSIDGAGKLWLLQARPITTLYPVPTPSADGDLRVYFSLNVAQGVLQPFTPLGLDFFHYIGIGGAALAAFPSSPEHISTVMLDAGGRIYMNATPVVRSQVGRRVLTTMLGVMEPRTGEILRGLFDEPRLAPLPAADNRVIVRSLANILRHTKMPLYALQALIAPNRARRKVATDMRRFFSRVDQPVTSPQEALDRAKQIATEIPGKVALRVFPVPLIAGMGAYQVLRRIAGPENEADTLLLTRGLPHNPTTQMNLRLWELSRQLKADPASARLISDTAPADLAASYRAGKLPAVVQRLVRAFLRRYGFRGVAEIDLGMPRWAEQPEYVFAVLANYIRQDAGDNAPDEQFRRSEQEAQEAFARIIARTRAEGPRGVVKSALLRFLYSRAHLLMGMRESPKFYLVAAIATARRFVLLVGKALAASKRIDTADDAFFLTFADLQAALDGADQRQLVASRRADYEHESKRQRVPRVLLSDGAAFYGESAKGNPGDLTGTPASPGVYSGIARVIMAPNGARLDPGEILVAPSTDPGWTPLFLSAGAVVVEMGGMMSHGAVVAREYGIPAVVGLLGATRLIRDGQRITVDGGQGIVVLDKAKNPA